MNLESLGWVDGLALLGLAVSLLIGLWRGLVFELMSIAGWVVAFVLARRYSAQVAAWLPVGEPGTAINLMAGLVLVFVLALFVWALLSWLLQKAISASPLQPIDRVLGGAFGLLRALVIGLVLVSLVRLTPLAASTDWQASRAVQGLGRVLEQIQPWLPDSVRRHLRAAGPGHPSSARKG